MGHALDSASMIGFNRNYKTIVADRYEFILNRFRRSAHQTFERSRDARTQHVNLVTNTRQFRTRAIVEFSARQYLVSYTRNQRVEIARQVFDQLPQHGRILALGKDGSARRHRLFAKTCGLQNSQRIQARAFNTQTRNRFGRIC